MSRTRKTEAGAEEPALRTRSAPTIAVPRRWLVGLLALVTLPWIVVAAIYVSAESGSSDVTAGDAPGSPEVMAKEASGAWGRLHVSPIIISPPIEYVPMNFGPARAPAWHFPQANIDQVRAFLTSSGLEPNDLVSVMTTARPDPEIAGVVLRPTFDVIRRLTPATRAAIYLELGKFSLNEAQADSYRFFGQAVTDWLGSDALIAPSTRAIVEPLIYSHQGFLYFADIDLVRTQISDVPELQRLVKRLLRQSTMLVKLRVDDPAGVSEIADYWGRAGRRTDIRPLLESVALNPADDRLIDISHLLPPLARQHLYRYPRITVADFEKPLLSNCFWTAFNFFSQVPDDRYLDVNVALSHLKQDFYIIQDGFQLGAVVAFSDKAGNLFHVAVYLADGLVFGKNGSSYLAPWSILPMDRLRGHYVENSDGWNITVHRRNDF
jgi:hypothetical protein